MAVMPVQAGIQRHEIQQAGLSRYAPQLADWNYQGYQGLFTDHEATANELTVSKHRFTDKLPQ